MIPNRKMHEICQRQPVLGNIMQINRHRHHIFSPEEQRKGQIFIPGEWSIKYQCEASMLCAPKTKLCVHSHVSLWRPQLHSVVIAFTPPVSEILPTFQVVLSLTFHFILPFFLGGGVSFCTCLNISALCYCGIEIKHSTSRITFPIGCLLG